MIEKLRRAGFNVHTSVQGQLNPALANRYPHLPDDYRFFLNNVESCFTKDEKTWFNTIADFNATNCDVFRWNEFEILSLEAFINGPQKYRDDVSEFWDNHITVAISCRNFYCYFAISLLSERFGEIVYGEEPEFEETQTVAANFSDFISGLTRKTLGNKFLEQVIC